MIDYYNGLLAIAFLVALAVACSFTFRFVKAKSTFGFIDIPKAHKYHITPTPLLGGVGVFLGSIAGMIILKKYCHDATLSFSFFSVSTSPVFILGLLDDKFSFLPFPKLIGLIIVSLIPGTFFFILGGNILFAFVFTFSFFFFINSFNLLDNVDGLCSTVGMAVLVSVFVHTRNPFIIPVIGAIAGFLIWNWPKAKIFLGDAGSLFIGGVCVIFVLIATENKLIILRILPVFWVPVYDTFSVIFIRLFEKRSIFIGGKDHFSHRLLRKGMTNSKLNIILGASTIFVGFLTLFLPVFISVLLLPVILIVVAAGELWHKKMVFHINTE